KKYNSTEIQKFLYNMCVENDIRIQIKNLFDRRNINPISHPGGVQDYYKPISKAEYNDYKEKVGNCIKIIISKQQR
ncbi:MAG: AbiA family abortive infection protein, partial [Spirochaetota bacterium]